jgi:hypothetical protein
VEVFETIGSGAPFANLLLKIHSRAPASDGLTFANVGLGYSLWIASYTINEIKEFDTYSGGTTTSGFWNSISFFVPAVNVCFLFTSKIVYMELVPQQVNPKKRLELRKGHC